MRTIKAKTTTTNQTKTKPTKIETIKTPQKN
jgi:hypothetical protein